MLREQIDACYEHELGPGAVPLVKKGPRKILGLVSPHAGYVYSGPIAAHGFASLANDGKPETFIIIGPNHRGAGSGVSIMTTGKWLTPLGEVEIDGKLAKELWKASEIIDDDEVAHTYEHSLEVQVPFLQHLYGSDFKIVPICMMLQDEETAREVGKAIAKVARARDVVIIASTDFTHVGSAYGQVPLDGERVDKFAKKQDEKVIGEILKLNPEGLLKSVVENDVTMCGYGPVSAMLFALDGRMEKAELLKYASSYDVAPGDSAVGYASIVIR